MKHLRKYIRQILLTEGMRTLQDLPASLGIKIEEGSETFYGVTYKTVYVSYCDVATGKLHDKAGTALSEPEVIYGTVVMQDLNPYEPDYDWQEIWDNPEKYDEKYIASLDCGGAYSVVYSRAASGWGPLLYDVAIEYATTKGKGVVSDRTSVSSDAQSVWEKYFYDRSDVNKVQCDDQYDTLTPSSADNIDMEIPGAENYLYDKDSITNNPLARKYQKEPTTINLLRDTNRLL